MNWKPSRHQEVRRLTANGEVQTNEEATVYVRELDGQEDGVPKACPKQAAADPRGFRTCVCANTFIPRGGTRGVVKGEVTSCRGTVWSAWQKPPVRRKGGRTGLPKKGMWSPRGTETTVLTYPCPTASRVSVAVRWLRQGNRQGW